MTAQRRWLWVVPRATAHAPPRPSPRRRGAKAKCREVFGEETRSNHKQFLFRPIAGHIQATAWGGLFERARRRSGYTSSAEQHMPPQALAEVVNALTPEEQAAVREFIDFLKRRTGPPDSPFLVAVNEFMDEHPELLRRLAQ